MPYSVRGVLHLGAVKGFQFQVPGINRWVTKRLLGFASMALREDVSKLCIQHFTLLRAQELLGL